MALPAAGLVAIIVGGLARLLSAGTLRWLAWKAGQLFIWGFVVPVVLENLFGRIMGKLMGVASDVLGQNGALPNAKLQLTALGAWLAIQLKVPESLALVTSAMSKRWAMSFVKKG